MCVYVCVCLCVCVGLPEEPGECMEGAGEVVMFMLKGFRLWCWLAEM